MNLDEERYIQPIVEQLESRLMLAVDIFAAGQTNEEAMQLFVDGAVVAEWTNIGGDAQNEIYERYTAEVSPDVTPDRIRIAFTNDLYDPANGIDRNLRIDSIQVNGQTVETESSGVFSTGTYLPGDGISPGFRQSEFLHSNGYFEYPPNATGSLFEIVARGDTRDEIMHLLVDDQVVAQWRVVAEADNFELFGFHEYSFQADTTISADRVKIAFVNDEFRLFGYDRNLTIHSLKVNGEAYLASQPDVFSTGLWRQGGVTPGFWQSGRLHVNGYVQFGEPLDDPGTPPTVTLMPLVPLTTPDPLLYFTIEVTDNYLLDWVSSAPNVSSLRLTGPNGYDAVPNIATRRLFPGASSGTIVYQASPVEWSIEDVGNGYSDTARPWGSEDNGEYSLWLNDGVISDAAGNFAPGGFLGTIVVDIPSAAAAQSLLRTGAEGEVRVFETGTGDLRIVGDNADNQIRIEQIGDQTIISDPTGRSTFNGLNGLILESNSYRRLKVNTKGGSDSVDVIGGSYADINVKTGAGNDAFSITDTTQLDRSLRLSLGAGQEFAQDSDPREMPQLGRMVFRNEMMLIGYGEVVDLTKTRFLLPSDQLSSLFD